MRNNTFGHSRKSIHRLRKMDFRFLWISLINQFTLPIQRSLNEGSLIAITVLHVIENDQ